MKLILITIFLLFPLTSNASIITFEFKGEFTQTYGDITNYLNIGDNFTGKVSYELGGIDADPSNERGFYTALEFSFEFNGFAGYATDADVSIINGTNNDFGCCSQYVVWGGRTNNTFGLMDSYFLQAVGFGLYNFSQYIFADTQLPTSAPQIRDYEGTNFTLNYVPDLSQPNTDSIGAYGIITSITAVEINEPANTVILALVLLLGFHRSRVKNQKI